MREFIDVREVDSNFPYKNAVAWNVSQMSNGAIYLPITWLFTTSISVTELMNGAQVMVVLNYLDGNSTSGQSSAYTIIDFYSLFLSESKSYIKIYDLLLKYEYILIFHNPLT